MKTMDLGKIETRAAALRALKRLRFTDPGFVMVRGAALRVGHDLSVQVAPGNFLITDKQGHLTYVPMLRHIGNTAESANAKHATLMQLIADLEIAPAGVELPLMAMCVALAQLAVLRTEGVLTSEPESDYTSEDGED